MIKNIKKLSTVRIVSLGFLFSIIIGAVLLMLPCSVKHQASISPIDAFYTSTSAVCVTGLIAVDAGDTFTPVGQFFLAMLIQFGGLGVTTIGAGVILALGKKVNIKGRTMIRETMNLDSGRGLVQLVHRIFIVTIIIELLGAALSFIAFSKDYPIPDAIGISLFHSIAAFNNSGFDILGGFKNLMPYRDNVLLNLVTCALIFLGGIGFLVIREVFCKKFRWKSLSMHSKVVISVSLILIALGTILIKLTEDISCLGAFFFSVSARTAGFSTYPLSDFSKSGLLILTVLMFIGASPGSTGGGIKTSTFFVIWQGVKSSARNENEKAYHYSIPNDAFKKASVVTFLALFTVVTGAYLMTCFDPGLKSEDVIFEVTSAFGTVGLSTGITPDLSTKSKILSMIIMYIGRLGPLTIASLWYFSKGERVKYPEGNITIG